MSTPAFSQSTFNSQLKKYYTWYTGGFILFLLAIAGAEQLGMSRAWIGYWFLFATIGLYAGIGWMTRTTDVAEYYVAGRRVPSFFNGMATGADWMSAASFIGMAGTLFLQGYDGLAWVMGWTGGFCLVALFLAPYLRKFGQFTIPDFLAERYGGNIVRFMGVICAITCSFVYVVAQIYGVGLIVSRMTGLEFGVGVFVGLAGILVCAMLGGMRAVTWTQVAQYIVLIIAYMTPVVWLGVKHIFFFQAEDGIRYLTVTGVQTCALPILYAAQPADRHTKHLCAIPLIDAQAETAETITDFVAYERIGDGPWEIHTIGRYLDRLVLEDEIGRASCRERG